MLAHFRSKSFSEPKTVTLEELLKEAQYLTLGRLLLLTRACFTYFQQAEVASKLGAQGILRETVNAAMKDDKMKEILGILNVDGPLQNHLTRALKKPESININALSDDNSEKKSYTIDDKTWINLIYAVLKDFIIKTQLLKPGTLSETVHAENDEPKLIHYCHELADSDKPHDQVKAEIIYGLMHLAATIAQAQEAAQRRATTKDSTRRLTNRRLDTSGIATVLAPIICQLLWGELYDLDRINTAHEMLYSAVENIKERSTLAVSFPKQFSNCYAANSSLILEDSREEREELYRQFGRVFREMGPLYAELKDAPNKMVQINQLLENTSMPKDNKNKIILTFSQHVNHITRQYSHKLDQLTKIHKALVIARDPLSLCESERTTAEETILGIYQTPASMSLTLFPIARRITSNSSPNKINRGTKASKSTGDLPGIQNHDLDEPVSFSALYKLLDDMINLNVPKISDEADCAAASASDDNGYKP